MGQAGGGVDAFGQFVLKALPGLFAFRKDVVLAFGLERSVKRNA